jgi:16S rRNA (guanine527-N7)-methyltransferase
VEQGLQLDRNPPTARDASTASDRLFGDRACDTAPATGAINKLSDFSCVVDAGNIRFNILDVGSGGGLPGVVLAITMPGVTVDCVDAVGKKAAFVRQVAGELGLPNLHAHHSRVESLRPPVAAVAGYHLITSRAFASLADFTAWTAHLLAPGGAWAAMKGQQPDDEIQALNGRVEVFHVEPLAPPGMTAQRCLVWMRPRPAVAPQP